MRFLSEQHLAAAKLVRRNALRQTTSDRERFIEMSNSLVICVCLSAKDRGGISLDQFDWSSLEPYAHDEDRLIAARARARRAL